jgi:CDP-diglyceride synthetase
MSLEGNMVQQNVTLWERIVRGLAGLILLWLVLYYPMADAWLWIFTFVGLFLIVTGLSGYCPINSFLKRNLSKK